MSDKVLIVPIMTDATLHSKYDIISLIFKKGEEGSFSFAGALSMGVVFMLGNPVLFLHKQ